MLNFVVYLRTFTIYHEISNTYSVSYNEADKILGPIQKQPQVFRKDAFN